VKGTPQPAKATPTPKAATPAPQKKEEKSLMNTPILDFFRDPQDAVRQKASDEFLALKKKAATQGTLSPAEYARAAELQKQYGFK
jgi:hypothetical protein